MKNLFENTFRLTEEMLKQKFPPTKCKECGKGFYFFDIDETGHAIIVPGVNINSCFDHGIADAVQEFMQDLDLTNSAILN